MTHNDDKLIYNPPKRKINATKDNSNNLKIDSDQEKVNKLPNVKYTVFRQKKKCRMDKFCIFSFLCFLIVLWLVISLELW